MEKLDLSKLKLASSSLGERIKTSGAQMGRSISSKMKEILQTPTPESKIVDEATAELLSEPNWGLNLRICAMISRAEYDGAEIVRAIKKKLLTAKNPVTQGLSLDLLETCTSNCDKVFSAVASEKLLDDMVKMIDEPRTDQGVKVRAMQLIRAWGESEDLEYLPVFRQTYMQLKSREIPPAAHEESFPTRQYNLESYLGQQELSPPEQYPVPNAGATNLEDPTFVGYGLPSIDEKKELLLVARNSLDILSSILNSDTEPKPIKDELTINMVEKCKQSLPVVQRIIETTSDDEVMLFDALNLHDELQLIISRHSELSAASEPGQAKEQDTVDAPGASTKLDEASSVTASTKEHDTVEAPSASTKTDPTKAGSTGSGHEEEDGDRSSSSR